MASATAENAAMMPAVEKPSELTRTITSTTYSTTVMMEMINVEADLSSLLLFMAAERAMMRTILMTMSPRMRKAIARTMASPVFCTKSVPIAFSVSHISFIGKPPFYRIL